MIAGKILVTGASGTIGRALLNRLNSTGESMSSSKPTQLGVAVGPHWRLGQPLGGALDRVESLVHLAARVHIRGKGFSDNSGFIKDNADGALALAQEASFYGVKRFVFVSSIGVLGSNSSTPLTESAPYKAHNAYTTSKALAEEKLMDFANSSDMELVILRSPAVLGSGVKGNVASLVGAVKRGIPLPFSRVLNQRQFVAVEDLVSAIDLALSHEGAPGEIFHVANPERVSTRDLCKSVASCIGVKPKLWPIPPGVLRSVSTLVGRKSLGDGLTGDLLISSEKITRLLGWQPRQSLDSALSDAIRSMS
ncbi:NAD-dependent epimerase/dehydratase family protein [Microbulbifer sp. HZ11]|uniref:NAD-dependent epimerase/dehydratase family protein n=1 Tax=Microbulbifer sp. HZ11 TaxID=1453501 RepID=UPI0009DFEE54|nr:NAD-dependent epimerase/dehydratase family protein [Microbulbifer sp. HZ11]